MLIFRKATYAPPLRESLHAAFPSVGAKQTPGTYGLYPLRDSVQFLALIVNAVRF